MNARPALLALVGTPLALALVACGGDDETGATDPAGTSTSTTSTTSASTSAATAPGSTPPVDQAPAAGTPQDTDALLSAARTGLDAVAGSTVFSVDREAGGWEVTVVADDGTESELGVSLDGTSVTRGPVEQRDDADDAGDAAERLQLLQDATVTYADALATATGEVPGLAVDGVDLDLEAGRATWDVQLGEDTADEQTVTIDAVTGEVLRVELDD